MIDTKETEHEAIRKLLAYTENMVGYARNSEWTLLQSTDQQRHQFLSDTLNSGIQLSPSAEQLTYLREKQTTIEALATKERDRVSASFGQSRKKLDQCSYYLRYENQPPERPDLHNRSL